jgi:hypothetical protein
MFGLTSKSARCVPIWQLSDTTNSRKDTEMMYTIKQQLRITRIPVAVIATALLIGLGGQALAQGAAPEGPTPGQSVITSRGPAFVTGRVGSLETTTIPGSFLMNNGNGTSTLTVPGGLPQTVATPR